MQNESRSKATATLNIMVRRADGTVEHYTAPADVLGMTPEQVAELMAKQPDQE